MTTKDSFSYNKSVIALLMFVLFVAVQFVAITHSFEDPIHDYDNSCQICLITGHIADVIYDAGPSLHSDSQFIIIDPPPIAVSSLGTIAFSSKLSRAPPVISA